MKPSEHKNDFSPEENARLAALPRTHPPAAMLEEKIITALKAKGLVQLTPLARRQSFVRLTAAIASILLVFVLGFALGRRQNASLLSTNKKNTFMLLIYESRESVGNESEKVMEYSLWAKSLRESNHVITGEKLKDSGQLLRNSQGKLQINDIRDEIPREALGGYFLIEAKDVDEALSIAESCPHLKYGGAIELRQIDKI